MRKYWLLLMGLLEGHLSHYRVTHPPRTAMATCPVFDERTGRWHDWQPDSDGWYCSKCERRG